MRGGRQAGKEEYRVVARGGKLAPGLIGNARRVQYTPAPHGERVGERSKAPCVHNLLSRVGSKRRFFQGSGSLPSMIPSKRGVDR